MLPDWLNLNAPGYENLTQDEKDAIMHFSLLWSLFEAQVLNTSASANAIQSKIKTWHESGLIDPVEFEQFKFYFIHRYVENGELNNRFEHLRLWLGDKPELVRSVLKEADNSIENIVTALLIIVLRYRNNFFHGIKWAYEFHDQLDNFNAANNLLMKVIEINNHA
ncbi:MAG: hypothetical protein KZQ94_01150 [Candidatus Thiodiazotropha sp. (ex Troendleina suluensis)]|nr:hypothetical protein [Candidatus Thiodiazotropha sp. (ex Troendleina suluensis)]